MLYVLVYLCTLLVAGVVIHRQRRSRLEAWESVSYYETRFDNNEDPTGNLELFNTLEWRVHVLNRRLVNLLQSPKLYLRARRIHGVLDMELEELTAELEIVHLAEAHAAVAA